MIVGSCTAFMTAGSRWHGILFCFPITAVTIVPFTAFLIQMNQVYPPVPLAAHNNQDAQLR